MPPEQNRYPDQFPEPRSRVTHNPWVIPLSIVLAGAFIGAGIFISKAAPPGSALGPQTNVVGDIVVNPVGPADHILGNPNAPIKIIEFSDTECPFCKEFQTTMQEVMDTYGKAGQVAWVYRHYPIDQLHTRAHHEAVATECANEIGGTADFWQYINDVFARTNSNDTLDPAALPDIAKEVGLDLGKFNTCLASTRYDNLILQDSQDAVRAGATGTPYSVLVTATGDKVAIKGAEPYDVMKALIDSALGGTPVAPADVSPQSTDQIPDQSTTNDGSAPTDQSTQGVDQSPPQLNAY